MYQRKRQPLDEELIRALYMERNGDGKHKYTLVEISRLYNENHVKPTDRQLNSRTLTDIVRRNKWDIEFDTSPRPIKSASGETVQVIQEQTAELITVEEDIENRRTEYVRAEKLHGMLGELATLVIECTMVAYGLRERGDIHPETIEALTLTRMEIPRFYSVVDSVLNNLRNLMLKTDENLMKRELMQDTKEYKLIVEMMRDQDPKLAEFILGETRDGTGD